MSAPLTGSTFIPYATSALDSLTGQEEGRDSHKVLVTLNDLEELKQQTGLVIERCLEKGEEDRIPLLFSIHDRIDTLISSLENESGQDLEFDFGSDFENELNMSSSGIQGEENDLDGFVLLQDPDQKEDKKPEKKAEREEIVEANEEEIDEEGEFECLICYDEIPMKETHKLHCGHRYCVGCLQTYLTGLIEVAEVEIECPDPSCGNLIAREDMKTVAGDEALQKHDRFAVLALLRKDQTTRWCPNCEFPFSGEPPTGQLKIICFECQTPFCYTCKDPWHEGKTCSEYQSGNIPDKKTRQWMKREGVQNCPHCGLPTIRSTGCRDMKCVNCGQHWKWEGDANETTLEKLAYFYPRSVKYIATSREAHENDKGFADELKTNLAVGAFAAVVLSPALLVTIPTILPAMAVTAGRKTKSGFESLVDRYFEEKEEEEEEEGKGKGKGKEKEKEKEKED